MKAKYKQGFTLIEILIALMIFAILSTITMHAIHDILGKYKRIQENFKPWHQLDDFISSFQFQSHFYVKRSVKADEGHIFPEFIGQNNYIEWTYLAPQENLNRIAYLCQNHQLKFRQWNSIDGLSRKSYREKIILANIDSCQFKYMDYSHNTYDSWNTENALNPIGVEVIIQYSNLKRSQFWFTFPPETYEFKTAQA
jgi:general secretion pathway protein J